MVFVLEEEDPTAIGLEVAQETIPQVVGRHLARSGARAAESVLGLPGDIQSLLSPVGGKFGHALGISQEDAPETPGFLTPLARFPTSKQLREQVTEKLTGEYLKPRKRGEELADEIVGDAVTLLLPGPTKIRGASKIAKHILRGVGTAGGANIASETVESLGVGKKGATATKLGSMLILSALGRGSPKKYVSNLYKEAEEAIKGSPKVSAKGLNKSLSKMKISLKKGLDAPSEKAVLSKLDGLQAKIKDGKIGVDELWASKRSINEEMSKVLFESPGKAAKARAKHLFKGLNRELNDELKTYGKKNPKFGKAFQDAEGGFAALAQSEVIGNYIKKHAKSPASLLLYPLVHAFPGPSVGGALGATAAYKSAQLGFRIFKSSSLRRHYKDVLKHAAAKNALAMNRSLKKLDDALLKEEPEVKKEGRFILEN